MRILFPFLSLAAAALAQTTVDSTILIFTRDSGAAASASSGLNGYGIPYQVVLVPQSGITLPALNSSAGGNYGGIIAVGQLSYQGGDGSWSSALTDDQWNALYDYQRTYGVRMVQYDVFPQPLFGTTTNGGCCEDGTQNELSFTDTSAFAQAGLNQGAGVSTQGLWHYPAQITDPDTTKEIAQFSGPGGTSTAAVINNFDGREQMAIFIGMATEWSLTSNFMQHAYITWMTRGLYTGFRRVYLNTQVDDMLLQTESYLNPDVSYRLTVGDMNQIKSWVSTFRGQMNPGSSYYPEIAFNGNGNIDAASRVDWDTCIPGPIWYDPGPARTPPEWRKPLGTGTDYWPPTPTEYGYSTNCVRLDSFGNWWADAGNRDTFMIVSHTFSHLSLDNTTYSDTLKEIKFNQDWFRQTGIGANANLFSPRGLVPPAITGLHNGDALRAWSDAGLTNCVGDSSRPVLSNPDNPMWPYTTNFATDGFDGFIIVNRWATRIYFNCDTAECTTKQWTDTGGQGTFQDLLNVETAENIRRFMGLRHEGFMFHQLNFRTEGLQPITYNGKTANTSIFQAWVETIVGEFTRLVNWPLVTLKQDDLADSFTSRQTRDGCKPSLRYTINNRRITAVTVSANGNTCSVPIPFTLPTTVTNAGGLRSEKRGNDPQTYWVTLNGSPQTFTLSSPITI